MNTDISIVIPNYNGKDLLKTSLPSILLAFRNPKNKIIEVIVVDDASNDSSVELIEGKFPEIKLIKHKEHRWFSATVNTGVKVAKGDLVCLLNTDIEVETNFLESAMSLFDDKKVFGVSLHEKGYGWAKGKFQDGFIVHEPGNEDNRIHETFWISGGSGVFRKSTWDELDGMDEKLLSPFYWEDMDLSYRAQKRGYRLLWDPGANLIHEHEATIKKINRNKVNLIWERNQLLFTWKNLTSPRLFRKHLVGIISRAIKHPGYIKVVFLALLRIREVSRKRKIEIKESKISDEAIFARFS